MKSPDEIKKGLGEAIAETSWVVDDGDMHDLRDACDNARTSMADALALIKQLETNNHQLLTRCERLEAECDALVDAVKDWGGSCVVCKHYTKPEDGFPCRFCAERFPEDEDKISHFEWRGVQKEETNDAKDT